MMCQGGWGFFPRRLDPDQLEKISQLTLERYKTALKGFVHFLLDIGFDLHDLSQVDGLAVEYKNCCGLTKSKLDYLVASLEFFYPTLKRGGMDWCKQVASGMASKHRTHHTVPLVSKPARFFGAHMASTGKARMGFGIALQQALGLRPSELLILIPAHIMKPDNNVGKFIFRLGADVGTKVKREQFAVLDSFEYTDLAWLLLLILDATAENERLFPFSYNRYNKTISDIEAHLGLALGATPHSPRAGFASEQAGAGVPVAVIREKGRCWSELSFRMYVDIITAAQVQAMVSLSCFSKGMDFAAVNFVNYFSFEAFVADSGKHAAKGPHQGPADRRVRSEGTCVPHFQSYKDTQQHSQAGAYLPSPVQGDRGKPGSNQPVNNHGGKGSTKLGRLAKGGGKGKTQLVLPKGYHQRLAVV